MKLFLCSLALLLVSTIANSAPTADGDWQTIPQQQLAYVQTEHGVVVMLLADEFTPKNTARFRQLIHAGFYHDLTFYRVIDQFVLQAGLMDGEKHPHGHARVATIAAEFSWPLGQDAQYVKVQAPDLLAAETGFRQGFAVGRDNEREWLLHCPNVVNLARGNDANSATSDFAIMQGQAPRHLDRNMSIVARVIWGQTVLNAIHRGTVANGGVIDDLRQRSKIIRITLGHELPKSQQLPLQMLMTNSATMQHKLTAARQRSSEFYQYAGNGQLDICYQQIPVRLMPTPDKQS